MESERVYINDLWIRTNQPTGERPYLIKIVWARDSITPTDEIDIARLNANFFRSELNDDWQVQYNKTITYEQLRLKYKYFARGPREKDNVWHRNGEKYFIYNLVKRQYENRGMPYETSMVLREGPFDISTFFTRGVDWGEKKINLPEFKIGFMLKNFLISIFLIKHSLHS